MKKLLVLTFYGLLFTKTVFGQALNFPISGYQNYVLEKKFNEKANNFHSSIKPYNNNDFKFTNLLDSVSNEINVRTKSKFLSAFMNSVPDTSASKHGTLVISPLFNLQSGLDFADKNKLLETGLGFCVRGSLKNRLSIFADYVSGNSSFPSYVDCTIVKTNVVPGQGYAYKTKLGYCNRNLDFYIHYSSKKFFDFEFGKGRNFWGNGYRSLLLSDNANSYLYFKITTTVWKIRYVNLYTNFKDVRNSHGFSSDFVNKYGTFHYLSWNISKRINLSFFESIIWESKDSSDTRGFDVNYLNPVIFFRPVEFSLNSPDNALMGLDLRIKIFNHQQVYGQLLLDDFIASEVRKGFSKILHPNDTSIQYGSWMNKQAFQLGFKSFDLAGISNLSFQTEYNFVRPYTYSHKHIFENYSHFGQPLAHPLGANFWESVSFLKYRIHRVFITAKFLYAIVGYDSTGTHFGQNIFQATFDSPLGNTNNIVVNQYGNHVAQGIKTKLMYKDIRVDYLLIPDMNLFASIGISMRTEKTKNTSQNCNYVYMAISTRLFNHYYDF